MSSSDVQEAGLAPPPRLLSRLLGAFASRQDTAAPSFDSAKQGETDFLIEEVRRLREQNRKLELCAETSSQELIRAQDTIFELSDKVTMLTAEKVRKQRELDDMSAAYQDLKAGLDSLTDDLDDDHL